MDSAQTKELIQFFRQKDRLPTVLLLSGNVYDIVPWDDKNDFFDISVFVETLTEKIFPWCLRYDISSGLTFVRGDKTRIASAMGLKKRTPNDNDVSAVMAALNQSDNSEKTPDWPKEPRGMFQCLKKLFDKPEQAVIVIIDHLDSFVSASDFEHHDKESKAIALDLINIARSSSNGKYLIVSVCQDAESINAKVRDKIFGISQIRIPKPDLKDRIVFLEGCGFKKDAALAIANISAGLSFKDLKKITDEGKNLSKDQLLSSVFSFKREILKNDYGDILEVLDTRFGFEAIGGLERPIAELKQIGETMKKGKTDLAPQGILFSGPPGTGKTALAEAFAKECGLNFVKPRDIKRKWVGDSEQRMSKFLSALKDLSPVVVFIDEFDQNQVSRDAYDGDSGVNKALFKKQLEIMSDTTYRGKILWILASNRPDLIDPALKRPGRCDLRIAFVMPNADQLERIFQVAFVQEPGMKHNIQKSGWREFAKKCKGYTGADVIEIVRRSWKHANYNGDGIIGDNDMKWGLEDYIPQILEKKEVALMTLSALSDCSSKSLLPSNLKEVLVECKEILGITIDDAPHNNLYSTLPKIGLN